MTELIRLWESLSCFVRDNTKERDDSHGHEHMRRVALNAIMIFEMERSDICQQLLTDYVSNYEKFAVNTNSNDFIGFKMDQILKNIITVAWLHDVADHKYDHDGRLLESVKQFIKSNSENNNNSLLTIIRKVSYSEEARFQKENPNREDDFISDLGLQDQIVRNIVSDADKLEALGKIGVDRCIEYSREVLKENGQNVTTEQINSRVLKHAEEKLLRLKDNYIRTHSGKKIAEKLHEEMVAELSKLKS